MVLPFIGVSIAAAMFFLSRRVLKAPLPDRPWKLFDHPAARWLDEATGRKLEGVYGIVHGKRTFGKDAVVKWTCIGSGNQRECFLSFFLEKDAAYFIFRAKVLRNRLLLKGYWCKQDTAETGEARMVVNPLDGGFKLVQRRPITRRMVLRGWFAKRTPFGRRLVLKYHAPLKPLNSFQILAHRGAGRNADFYPYSENSLEMLRLGPLLGATGVEIDIMMTKDNVPILFHDLVFSYRSLDNYYLVQPVSSYTIQEVKKLRLKKGEKIPTLEEAMEVILQETPLTLVWLDVKYEKELRAAIDVQKKYTEKARELGRDLQIYIGIAETGILKRFTGMDNHRDLYSLVELTSADVEDVNADIWAPRWTDRLSEQQIADAHRKGKRVFVWTVDLPDLLANYMQKGYDGILTNVPALLAYYCYSGVRR